jgi:hypothetical protein
MSVLILCGDMREGHRLAMALGGSAGQRITVAGPGIVIPGAAGVRGRIFTCILEGPSFLDLPNEVRRQMREQAGPCLAAEPMGVHLVAAELNRSVMT